MDVCIHTRYIHTCISCWRVEIKFSPASIHKFLTNIFYCPSSIYRGKITTTSGYPQKGKKSANGETWPKKAWPSHSMPGQARPGSQAGRETYETKQTYCNFYFGSEG